MKFFDRKRKKRLIDLNRVKDKFETFARATGEWRKTSPDLLALSLDDMECRSKQFSGSRLRRIGQQQHNTLPFYNIPGLQNKRDYDILPLGNTTHAEQLSTTDQSRLVSHENTLNNQTD